MNWLIVAAVAALIVLTILVKAFSGNGSKAVKHPYQKHSALFSPDDRIFYRALKEAVGEEYEIFGKIRVADIVLPKKGASRNDARLAFSPIAGRHFDFVLCDKNNLTVTCAIQLRDKTNPAKQAEGQKNPLQTVCEAVALPFVRFDIKADYYIPELREKLQVALRKEPFFLVETDGRKEPRISNIEDMKF
ncbi:MAG TPA: DUF2726 domain-containing protein [Methylococcaceae bacterium]|nr:DUF2726 domain-containing protein [Methylococcaceae bacterium]